MNDAICATCGTAFTPAAELRDRFPGWTPRECPACYRRRSRASQGGRGRGGEGRGGGGGQGSRSSRATRAEAATPGRVLDPGSDGPDSGVFTDGAASPNPGPGGWGAVYVIDGEVVAEDRGHEPFTTNNRMELTAMLKGIDLVPEGTAATIYSDSNLVVRTVTEWAPAWEARGWRRRSGPVENLDLVRPLYERLQARPELTVRWIKAHAGFRWNEYADRLATAYARGEA